MREVFVLHRSVCVIFAFAAIFACSVSNAQPRIKAAQPGVWPGFARGQVQAVRVSGTYAYIALGQDGLAVIDISDPTRPIPVGSAAGGGQAWALDLAGNYAYVAASSNGLQIFDLASPTHPSSRITFK